MSYEVKALITITDRGRAEHISALKKYPHISFLAMGVGTASSEIMDLLGLDSADKDVVFSLVCARELSSMLSDISGKRFFKNTGSGIAFVLPLTGISRLVQAAITKNITSMEANMNNENTPSKSNTCSDYSLVMAITDPGCSDDIMELARGAGARGGTVIYARGMGDSGAGKFLGINIQEEKELVTILCLNEDRLNIMKAINEGFGLRSESKALVLSLPVEDMVQVS
ncbi:hypothetical protein LJC01_02835 [Clostridiaceae bacterium OttesenSCG-928-D20]|nr:hypothetical protein [Clostridiaceae bacterium OttesenSCG-928-D20]